MRFLYCLIFLSTNSYALTESYYSEIFCKSIGGVEEVVLSNRTRVDCVTDEYVIEVDFAKKWYEGVGQSLHYATVTGKKPGLALIIDETEERFYQRASNLRVCPEIKLFRINK